MSDSAKQILLEFRESGRTALHKYPGVTSILKETAPYNPGIEKWIEREGEAEAKRIFEQAQRFGTNLDAIVNDRLTLLTDFKKDDYKKEISFGLYCQLEPLLDRVVPYSVQLKLWSDRLQARGILDCLGLLDGELTLIDIKNSRSEKNEAWIQDYFLQCAFYAMMIYELTGIEVKKIALLIAVRGANIPQVFVKDTKDYVEPVLRRVSMYRAALSAQ